MLRGRYWRDFDFHVGSSVPAAWGIRKENGPFELFHIERCKNSDCEREEMFSPLYGIQSNSFLSFNDSRAELLSSSSSRSFISFMREMSTTRITPLETLIETDRNLIQDSLGSFASVSVSRVHMNGGKLDVLNPRMKPPNRLPDVDDSDLISLKSNAKLSSRIGSVRVTRVRSRRHSISRISSRRDDQTQCPNIIFGDIMENYGENRSPLKTPSSVSTVRVSKLRMMKSSAGSTLVESFPTKNNESSSHNSANIRTVKAPPLKSGKSLDRSIGVHSDTRYHSSKSTSSMVHVQHIGRNRDSSFDKDASFPVKKVEIESNSAGLLDATKITASAPRLAGVEVTHIPKMKKKHNQISDLT